MPTNNQDQTTLSQKIGQHISPGLESFLSAVPALLGAYESARGVPIGAPLQMLGKLGLQHSANRQQEQQDTADVAHRLVSLSQRGLLPQDATLYDSIARMTPKAAEAELSDIEAQEVAERNTNWQFKAAPDGRAYMIDPRDPTKQIRMPMFDDPAKAQEQAMKGMPAEFKAWKTQFPKGTYSEFRTFKDTEAKRLHEQEQMDSSRIRLAAAPKYVTAVADAKMANMEKLPVNVVPGLRDKVIFDRTTGRVVSNNALTAGEFWHDTKDYVAIDKVQANTILPKLEAMRRETLRLMSDAAKILPKSTGSQFSDWVNTRFNIAAIPLRAMSGDATAQDMLNLGNSVALQYQQILTGTARPMNATEFANVSGIRLKGEGIIGEMSTDYKAALVPRPGDTREQAAIKAQNWATLYDAVMEVKGFTPKQSMMEEMNRVFDSIPAAPGLVGTDESIPAGGEAPAPAATPKPDEGWH